MTLKKMEQDSNPLFFVTINNEARKNQLCRALARTWESPVFFIKTTIRETVSHVIEKSLLGETIYQDLMLIDLEAGERNAYAIINTIRSIPGLQHTPLITLLDGENIELLSQTYDAGANLVIFWDKLEVRTGDIATLVIDNWLSTENEYPDDMRAHSS